MKKMLVLLVVVMAALSAHAQEMYFGRRYQSVEKYRFG